jgi:NAD(P)-dependent dehydrogenase (short-subunit alcohol dehydrogenase family)
MLGTAIANRLAREGAVVMVASRQLSKAQSWVDRQETDAKSYVPLQLDLSDNESINSCFESIRQCFSIPTIVIANASNREGLDTPFNQLTHDTFGQLFGVDVAGHVLLLRQIVAHLNAKASIVFLSSVYGQVGVDHRIYPKGIAPTPVQYSGTKSASLGVTRWLASYWGAREVRVNAVVAGGVKNVYRQTDEFFNAYSDKTMLRRMAEPDEIASAVAFLASDESSYVTGQCLVVDGGFTGW